MSGARGLLRNTKYPFLFAVLDDRHPLDCEISHYVVVIAEHARFWCARPWPPRRGGE